MSWLFGSSKKKELQVTVDPHPVDGFCVVRNRVQQSGPSVAPQQSDSIHHLYPNLDESGTWGGNQPKLPYPTTPSPSARSANLIGTNTTRSGGVLDGVHVHNQLESVPFQLSVHLQEKNGTDSRLDVRAVSEALRKAKRHIANGEYDYNFTLERRILKEERMVNGQY